ncbi:tubulin epsilon and delta complex protein 1 isoform X2 [Myotis myotis]|uniref:tubulin epsilon and delta complex protein 1 isoform X2 n=1 Tax=Myotis myotis TaxID=51298 RepID=UPI00174E826C|nr:tubulin epsilon and delta complex protein 1 isoform X2 [Myotis myotis]XP_036162395.1 tubulin epsilon and delta complex protein 1 isoform X2 [Myotis myotis]
MACNQFTGCCSLSPQKFPRAPPRASRPSRPPRPCTRAFPDTCGRCTDGAARVPPGWAPAQPAAWAAGAQSRGDFRVRGHRLRLRDGLSGEHAAAHPLSQAPALWRLLFRVLSLLRADRASASRAPEAQARWVKAALRAQGYPRLGLARLPEDGSQGSRELLLALAWLLAREPLPERLLAQTRVRLGDEMPVCECGALASPGQPAPRVDTAGPVDVRRLQWLMGKLRFRWRNLMASQQEQCALLGKIHAYTRGCHGDRSLGHLSVAETELLRDPEGGRQLLQRLESENARLEAALEWRRRELVFWQWMDTVLGACPPEASQPTFPPRLRGRGRRAGAWGPVAWELQALQEELQAAVGARRAAWAARVGGQGPEWSAARQAAQEAVGRELAALRQAWARGGGRAQPHRPHRLVRTEAGGPGGPGLRAAEVIGVLRSREACLEEMLCQLQEQCRQQLARLAGALPGLIWIPPPRR